MGATSNGVKTSGAACGVLANPIWRATARRRVAENGARGAPFALIAQRRQKHAAPMKIPPTLITRSTRRRRLALDPLRGSLSLLLYYYLIGISIRTC